ncbi:ABC transporter permease [Agrobacterium tumefaciens]|uniref:ABC transporter permease n=1 Tax=Agrobacterium tumefaciens TaxID=358 RepID=UPI003BA21215
MSISLSPQTLGIGTNSRAPVVLGRSLARARGMVVAIVVFFALLLLQAAISPGPTSYFDLSFLISGATPLALAAFGQTLVILSGGFDLSAGAVISLVNAVLAANMDPVNMEASVFLWTLVGVATGMAVGAFNGLFIAIFRLQPIVVTLSTMFIIQGITLLVLDRPGGFVAPSLGTFYMGDAIPEVLPSALLLLAILVLGWGWLKRTPYGVSLYAVGSDRASAAAVGVRVPLVRFITYVLAGGLYGMAGVFVSAQTGSGDPTVGNPLLLSIFAAVVIGGTRLGGGKGGPVGTIFGALVLMIIVNILLALNVSAYFSTIAEGIVLICAVLLSSVSRHSVFTEQLQGTAAKIAAWRAGRLVSQRDQTDRRLAFVARNNSNIKPPPAQPSFLRKHAETLRYAVPAYVCLVIVLIATQFVLGSVFGNWNYWNSLLVLSAFLAILALGQGSVILTGGLDLSVPWMIGLCGVLLAGAVQGSDMALIYAVPMVILMAAVFGFLNGFGVVVLGLSPILVTLAMNGILQGIALLYSNGTPSGFASPGLRWFMTGHLFGTSPVIYALVLFVTGGVLLLGRTTFGRCVYAIGNSVDAARLSGVRTGRVTILVYMLSAVCAGVVGVLLTGFSGQASLGMGDDYLLPSIAVVVVGGALITGGRGHYLGMVGGALLLTALQTLLAGTSLPYAFRAIIFGCVVLAAVVALRERSN